MTQAILMVCLGNICRSPLAEGIMRHLITERGLEEQFTVDSCGTGSWHAGEAPHSGSRRVATQNGISLEGQRSRQLTRQDIVDFDWLVAMDTSNRNGIRHVDEQGLKHERTVLLLDYAGENSPRDVPDPYYEGGFEGVYKLIYRGCEGLLEHILAQS
ncbi:MAG TPA: low molecular weight phosphotyrosine protein phosphatase [Myxococcales bacterium]|nr:low molecular weight phosphotyrosine protein phosphatase [Myxococcales bacterium]HIN85087.1 low molecular weight phosphotyrosine protein phosphatase [Myxococcales bacterium]